MKKELIYQLLSKAEGKSGKTLAMVLMNLILTAHKNQVYFDETEFTMILNCLKEGKSEKEIQEMDQLVSFIRNFNLKK